MKDILFDTYADALDDIVKKIKSRKVDLGTTHILLVPEKDTLKCEQMLFSKNGAMDVQVYSFSRWFYKLGGGDVLPKNGAVMILKDILSDLDLKCFFKSRSFNGFCVKLYDTLCQLDQCNANLNKIKLSGALALKIDDINLINAEFKKRTKDMLVGLFGKITHITQRLIKDDILKNTHVYAANFSKLSVVERQLFDLLKDKALSFTFNKVKNTPFVSEEARHVQINAKTTLFNASSPVACLKAAAVRIFELCTKNVSLNDIALVIPPTLTEEAKRIFNEFDIPLYVDKTTPLSTAPLALYLSLLIGLKRPCRKDFILLSKNPYSLVLPHQSDIFQNYVNSFLIDYSAFYSPFTLLSEDNDPQKEQMRLSIAEKVRLLLTKRVTDFWQGLEKLTHQNQLCDFLKAFLNKALKESAEKESAQKEKIFLVIDALDKFLCNSEKPLTKKRLQFLLNALQEGINAESLSGLPRTKNCVLASDAGIFKGSRFKHTFVVCFNEGVVPEIKTGSGLIAEEELKQLNKMGLDLNTNFEYNMQKEHEFMQLLAASQHVFLASVVDFESKSSPLLYEIKQLISGDIEYGSSEKDRLTLSFGQNEDIVKLTGSKSFALEQFIMLKNQPCPFVSSLLSVFNDAKYYLDKADRDLKPGKIKTDDIFFGSGTVSISQLQAYFACPYKHFLDYGLRLKPQKSGSVDRLDIGNAVHKAAELFVKSNFNENQLDQIVDEALSKGVYRLKGNERLKERLKLHITQTILRLKDFILCSDFTNPRAEIHFGRGLSMLKGCDLGGVTLKGVVDYADTYGEYVRIIDYKTSNQDFKEEDIYYGKKLQLPLYMQTFKENGFMPAAMLYFVFKAKWAAEDERFVGVFYNDAFIASALDSGIKNEQKTRVLSQKVRLHKDKSTVMFGGARDYAAIDDYLCYAKKVSSLAVQQIQNGYITPSPLKSKNSTTCDYCLYLPACGFKSSPRIMRPAAVADKDNAQKEENK